MTSAVTGTDRRTQNGGILRYAIIHLPNGQMMMTFVDITDSANVEKALKEKNEALQRADQLKNDFVQHVSYELRSPLTNIIGFTELLTSRHWPLTPRQRDYVDHIGSSSEVLLTIVNDILDLATVDAGIMELDIGEVRIDHTIRTAADSFRTSSRTRSSSMSMFRVRRRTSMATRTGSGRFCSICSAMPPTTRPKAAPSRSPAKWSTAAFSSPSTTMGRDVAEELNPVSRRFRNRDNGGRRRGAGSACRS